MNHPNLTAAGFPDILAGKRDQVDALTRFLQDQPRVRIEAACSRWEASVG